MPHRVSTQSRSVQLITETTYPGSVQLTAETNDLGLSSRSLRPIIQVCPANHWDHSFRSVQLIAETIYSLPAPEYWALHFSYWKLLLLQPWKLFILLGPSASIPRSLHPTPQGMLLPIDPHGSRMLQPILLHGRQVPLPMLLHGSWMLPQILAHSSWFRTQADNETLLLTICTITNYMVHL
jgi:hypothetical protein